MTQGRSLDVSEPRLLIGHLRLGLSLLCEPRRHRASESQTQAMPSVLGQKPLQDGPHKCPGDLCQAWRTMPKKRDRPCTGI